MKRVLMIAYHFPPFTGSSGVQRSLRFVQHLPSFGWEPIVLTAHPLGYERTGEDLEQEVPASVPVERAFALDAARHLSLGGSYPGILARPDRWMTWRYPGIRAGLRLIREWQPHVIWSTYPIATAHVIGSALRRRTGLPWIADFRDPMAQDAYPPDPKLWRSFKAIEEQTIREARCSAFTSPGAARSYRERYPDAADKITVIENGFEESSFAKLNTSRANMRPHLAGRALRLLHSGVVYPSERDPTQLFAAVRRLADTAGLSPDTLRIVFRAPAHDRMLHTLAQVYAVQSFIEVLPPIPHDAALEEMLRADGLLVLQASNCNQQIPAKLYEYFRAARPILGLTDPRGDTAGAMRDAGVDTIAPLDSVEGIAHMLNLFITAVASERAPLPRADYVARSTRRCRTEALANALEAASPAS